MDLVLRRASRGLEALMAVGMLAMVALVFGNVVLRYVFNSGIDVSEELSRWLFIWITFLGAIVAMRERSHLGSGFFIDWLGDGGKKACLVLGYLLMLGACALVLKGSWDQVKINADVTAPSSGLSMAIVYASGLVFGAAALLILAFDLFRLLSGRIAPAELARMRESEEENLA
jgi:TRAP-type C4-dicarboxylate transport system permease small subunit